MNKFYLKYCKGFSVWYIQNTDGATGFILKNLMTHIDLTFMLNCDYSNKIAKELYEYLYPKFDGIQYEPDERDIAFIKMHNPYVLLSDEELLYIHLKYGSILKG